MVQHASTEQLKTALHAGLAGTPGATTSQRCILMPSGDDGSVHERMQAWPVVVTRSLPNQITAEEGQAKQSC